MSKLQTVLDLLAKVGCELPSDTDESNFVDRWITAASTHEAVEDADGAGSYRPPEAAKEVGYVPMSMAGRSNRETGRRLAKELLSRNGLNK